MSSSFLWCTTHIVLCCLLCLSSSCVYLDCPFLILQLFILSYLLYKYTGLSLPEQSYKRTIYQPRQTTIKSLTSHIFFVNTAIVAPVINHTMWRNIITEITCSTLWNLTYIAMQSRQEHCFMWCHRFILFINNDVA